MSRWQEIFSVKEKDGKFKISYDSELDPNDDGHSKLAGSLYMLMRQYPYLIDEIIFAAKEVADELTQPFNDILNEKP